MDADNLQILSFSDERANLFKPSWWQVSGICYAFDSYVGNLTIIAKATVDGQIQIRMSGAFSHWIDYKKLIVNDKTIFNTLTPTRHDKIYVYNMNVKAGDKVTVQAEWFPHSSNT